MQFAEKFAQAFRTGKQGATAAASTAKTVTSETAKTAASKAPAAAKATGVAFFQGVVANMIALEAVDALVSATYTRRRRKEIEDELKKLTESLDKGDPAQTARINELLDAIPRRRSFGQVIRDLPSRMFRRLWRAVLVEAGWWTMLLTAPVWAPVAAAYTLYSWLVVFPTNTVMEHFFQKKLDLDKWLVTPGIWVRNVLDWTLLKGWKIFMRGIEMRLYGRRAFATSKEGREVLTESSPITYAEIKEIKDGYTAAAWGRALAQNVTERRHDDVLERQMAYASIENWAADHIATQFRTAVTRGFREGTPFLFRDLVPEV